MKNQPKYSRGRRRKRINKPIIRLSWLAALLLIGVIIMVVNLHKANPKATTSASTPVATERDSMTTVTVPADAQPEPTETTVPPETEPQILPYFVDMVEQNPDMVGWIKIDGTKLDYPLMYTPEEPDKYLHLDFDGNFSVGGLPYIDEACSLDPVSDNLLIYGHNMVNGTMFRTLMRYDQKNFWQEHPVIHLSTLYDEKTYEILAACYDRVYFKYEDCFKFYQFIDAENEEAFNEAISYFKENSLYDTGVTAEYGDKLITLVTCAYHVDNGRFIVVAKEVPDSE